MSKHTPGPWEVGMSCDSQVFIPADDPTGQRNIYLPGKDDSERKANACLIATAPDLLEKGEKLLAAMDKQSTFFRHEIAEAAEELAAAIAKAKGE